MKLGYSIWEYGCSSMPVTRGICAYLARNTQFRCVFVVSELLNCFKASVSGIHSLHQFKHKKFVRSVNRSIGKKSNRSAQKREEKEPKVYMRNAINSISNILRFSTWGSAQEQLEKLPIKWDSYTINQVLKTHPPMEKTWLFFNWASGLKGFKHDQFTYTTMLDIFGEAGRISSMKYVFQQMQEKGVKIDAVTYTSLLHWLSKHGGVEEAFKLWEEMKCKGCKPTVVTYTALMKVLFDNNRPKEAAGVYKEMLEVGCSPNCQTYTVLIEFLAGAGKFKAALEILGNMQEAGVQPDKATCNILVQKCSKAGEVPAMTHTLLYMKENSIVLRRPIYLEALQALRFAGESDDLLREVNAHLAFERVDEEGSNIEATTTDSLFYTDKEIVLIFLARVNLVAIDYLIDEMVYKDIQMDPELISAVIQVNCANFRPSGALIAFNYSVKMGLKLEKAVYVSLIGSLLRTNSFLKILEIVEGLVKVGITLGTYLVSLLIYKFGCAGMSASSAKIFYSLPSEQNSVTYTALIDAYLKSGDVDQGLDLYINMERKGFHASSGTYKVLINGLQEAGRIHEANIYQKKLKSLQSYKRSCDNTSMEERLCNLLFDKSRAL